MEIENKYLITLSRQLEPEPFALESEGGLLSITPTPPAWASIKEVPTGVPAKSPNSWIQI